MEFVYFIRESRLIHNDTVIITAEFITEPNRGVEKKRTAYKFIELDFFFFAVVDFTMNPYSHHLHTII